MFFYPSTAHTHDNHFQNLIAEIKSRLPGREVAIGTRINDTNNLDNISKHPAELPPGKAITDFDVNSGEYLPISTVVTKTKHKTNNKTKSTSNDSKTNQKKPNQTDKRNGGTKQNPGNKKQPVQSKNISSFFRAKNQSSQNDHRTMVKCHVKKESAVIEIDSDSQSPKIIRTNKKTNSAVEQPLNSTILPRNTKQQPFNSTILSQKIKKSRNKFSNSINIFSPVLGNKTDVHKDRKKANMLAYDSDSDQFNSSDSSESQSILQNVSSISSNRKSPQLFICENNRTRIEHSTVLQESDIETESEDEQITHLSGLTNEISNLVEEAIRNPPSQSHFAESLIPNAPTEFSCTQIESQ